MSIARHRNPVALKAMARGFHPKDLPQKRELEYASESFLSIELNGPSIPCKLRNLERWVAETPDDFIFSIKGPRSITHPAAVEGREHPPFASSSVT
jgi:uncharacterized protein YecE (DUF72 family)